MNEQKIKELLIDYEKALQRLNEGIALPVDNSIIIDGVIQRFEYTFKLCWKLIQAYLKFLGVQVNSPRYAIKEAFKMKLIDDGNRWIDMLEDRNRTSNIYDENEANSIYSKIIELHIGLLNRFLNDIKEEYKKVTAKD